MTRRMTRTTTAMGTNSMKSGRMTALGAAAAALACATGLSHASTPNPSRPALTRAVRQYLSEHGDLCVGKFTWPRIVTTEDRREQTNDAVQLPVLERLGLVTSTQIPRSAASMGPARSYSLTAKGKRYYLFRRRIILGAHDRPVEQDEDLCVARLSLDKVVKWTPPERVNGHLETIVRYTYRIQSADWMADPRARKAFPVVDRIIRGQGHLLMTVTAQLHGGEWTPVLPDR